MSKTHPDFTVRFYMEENQKKAKIPLPRRELLVENSSGLAEPVVFIEIFVEVVTDRNQKKLQPDGIQPSAHYSLVPAVIFEDAEGAFGLDRTVHAQQSTVNAVEVV